MGKIIAKLSPGRSAGHDPWAWGSKCGPRGAGISGREGPWEPKNGRETRGNICLEIGKKMPEKWKPLETVVSGNILWGPVWLVLGSVWELNLGRLGRPHVSGWCWKVHGS